MDKLTYFEDYLREKHAKQYLGLDDDQETDFDEWVEEQDVWDLVNWADWYVWNLKQKNAAEWRNVGLG